MDRFVSHVYENALKRVLVLGDKRMDRTGVGTRSLFGMAMRFHMGNGLPLVTTKKLHVRSIIHELLWMLSGDTNIKYLHDNGVTIWDEWADENGDLGPVYGKQWRNFGGVDQISNVIHEIKENPTSRRLLVSAWNPGEVEDMALPPCHCMFQFFVSKGELSMQMYQRSADMFLGVPFNIASYSILLHMVAQQTNLKPGEFTWLGGDCHLYDNHETQAKQQLNRMPRLFPRLRFARKPDSIFDYKFEDFIIEDYDPWPSIKAEVAV